MSKLNLNTAPLPGDVWPKGAGELASLIRSYDWAGSDLGPLENWPASLKNALDIILQSPIPMIILWGPAGICLYNDPYAVFAAGRHPSLLGSPVLEGWHEVADFNRHVMDTCLAGDTLTFRDQPLILSRNGVPEEVWLDLYYSPILNDGVPTGVLAIVIETTAKNKAEQDRKKAEDAYIESQRRLSVALDASHMIGTWDWDIVNDLVYSDARFATLFGVDPDMAEAGTPISNFFHGIHQDDSERVYTEVQTAIATGDNFISEYRLLLQDGSIRWIVASGKCEYGADGTPLRFPGAAVDITERKRIENLLIQKEQQQRLIIDTVPALIAHVDKDMRYQLNNAAYKRWFGVEPESLKGTRIRDFSSPEREDLYRHYLERTLAGEDVRFELRLPFADGKEHDLEVAFVPDVNDRGELEGFVALGYDITDRKETERLKRDWDERSRLALEASHVFGIWNWDVAADRFTTDDHLGAFLQLTPEESKQGVPLERIFQAVHPEDRPRVEKVIYNTPSEGGKYTQEFRIIPEDGTTRWLSVRGYVQVDENNNPLRVLGIGIDTTLERQAVEALRESEARFRQAANATPQVMWTANVDGQLDYVNARSFEYSGHIKTENGIIDWSSIIHPDDLETSMKSWMHSVETGEPYEVRQRIWFKGTHEYRWNLTLAMPARDEKGAIVKWVGTNTDIEDQIRAEENIRQAKDAAETASIAKSEFLANMSHEIRTPMNAIIGLAHILKSSKPLTDKQQEYLNTLHTSADALLALINDLLDISKIEAQSIDLEEISFNLNRLTQDVISIMMVRAREKGLKINLHDDCVQDRVFLGDPTRVRQIILNLCSNAIKFTDEGSIDITLSCLPSLQEDRALICIAVKDTGIGIPPEKREAIFEKFSQADTSINRKYGGTGLGLTITKSLTEIMGGSIAIESTVGEGSTFKISIPFKLPPQTHALPVSDNDAGPLPAGGTGPGAHILLVEDYEPNILVAGTYLELFGYSYDVARNRNEVLEKTGQHSYVVILMDIELPDGSGLDLAKIIREKESASNRKKSYIIGMTAHALSGDRDKCLAAGMDNYIAKPFDSDDLKTKLSLAETYHGHY